MTNFSQQHLPLVEKVMVDFIAEYTENERLKEAMLYSRRWQTITPIISVNNGSTFQKRWKHKTIKWLPL